MRTALAFLAVFFFFLLCDNVKGGQLGGDAVTPTAVFPLLYSHAFLHHFDFFSPLSLFLNPVFYCLNLCVWKHFIQNSLVKFKPLTCEFLFLLLSVRVSIFLFRYFTYCLAILPVSKSVRNLIVWQSAVVVLISCKRCRVIHKGCRN